MAKKKGIFEEQSNYLIEPPFSPDKMQSGIASILILSGLGLIIPTLIVSDGESLFPLYKQLFNLVVLLYIGQWIFYFRYRHVEDLDNPRSGGQALLFYLCLWKLSIDFYFPVISAQIKDDISTSVIVLTVAIMLFGIVWTFILIHRAKMLMQKGAFSVRGDGLNAKEGKVLMVLPAVVMSLSLIVLICSFFIEDLTVLGMESVLTGMLAGAMLFHFGLQIVIPYFYILQRSRRKL